MTAGQGILHIETPPEALVVSGGLFHGIQLWVNLPAKKKWVPPAYQPLEAGDVALLASRDAGALLRLIAGEVAGVVGPGSTQTPISLIHATITPGSMLELPWNPSFNALAYVLTGSGEAGADHRPIRTGQLVRFGSGDWMRIRAKDHSGSSDGNLEVLFLGGAPIGEHVEHYGPFVMNTRAEIGQALEDFQAGRLGRVPANALMPHVPDPSPVRTEKTGI
jgi:redox-sensitive bicupin YhaK (pirin superfamily)